MLIWSLTAAKPAGVCVPGNCSWRSPFIRRRLRTATSAATRSRGRFLKSCSTNLLSNSPPSSRSADVSYREVCMAIKEEVGGGGGRHAPYSTLHTCSILQILFTHPFRLYLITNEEFNGFNYVQSNRNDKRLIFIKITFVLSHELFKTIYLIRLCSDFMHYLVIPLHYMQIWSLSLQAISGWLNVYYTKKQH